MQGPEIRALRRLQREQAPSTHVFVSERAAPLTAKSFHTLISRLGERAGMPFPIHPHMLRHACGFALANAGHDTGALQAWLGHLEGIANERQLDGIAKAKAAGVYKGRKPSIDADEVSRLKRAR